MSYELFDIKDKETHEYIRDLTREQLAQYVLGQLPGYDKGGNFRKYEPLRDEVLHIIHCDDGTVYYDSEEVVSGKRKKERIDSRLAVFHVRLVRTKGGYIFCSDSVPIGEHDCAYSQGTGARRLSDLPEDEWVRRGARFAKLACPELCRHILDGV